MTEILKRIEELRRLAADFHECEYAGPFGKPEVMTLLDALEALVREREHEYRFGRHYYDCQIHREWVTLPCDCGVRERAEAADKALEKLVSDLGHGEVASEG
jgi:hypothetical protein